MLYLTYSSFQSRELSLVKFTRRWPLDCRSYLVEKARGLVGSSKQTPGSSSHMTTSQALSMQSVNLPPSPHCVNSLAQLVVLRPRNSIVGRKSQNGCTNYCTVSLVAAGDRS